MNALASVDFRVAIPARYGSTRLPGKPLLTLAGKPLLEHTYSAAVARGATEVILATDDDRVVSLANGFGAEVCLTSSDHETGTDRLAEVAYQRAWPDDAIVVNLQGDEPLMPPQLLRQVATDLEVHPDAGMATLATAITEVYELFDPNAVKVVCDQAGYALYFSRAPIPYDRKRFAESRPDKLDEGLPYLRHLGIYAYRAAILRKYPTLPRPGVEQAELLEQLRALWHGIRIHVQQASALPPAGVDTKEDLTRVRAILASGRTGVESSKPC